MHRSYRVTSLTALALTALIGITAGEAYAAADADGASKDSILIGGAWYRYDGEALEVRLADLNADGRQMCGDFNGNDFADMTDVVFAVSYLFGSGGPPADFNFADCDDHLVYTLNDLAVLLRNVFGPGPPPICPPSQGPLSGAPNDGIYLHTFETAYPAAEILPPGQDKIAVHFHLTTDTVLTTASLSFSIRVGTEIPTIDSVTLPTSDMNKFTYSQKVDHAQGEVVIGLISVTGAYDIPPGTYEYGFVHLSATPLPDVWRPILIEWDSLPPAQATYEAHYPYVVGDDLGEEWEPTILHFPCTGDIRGNVDYDDSDAIDITDLVYLVNYMFKGGWPPLCFEEADVDVSIGLDVGDLVYLVNYMFKDGPAPLACFPDN